MTSVLLSAVDIGRSSRGWGVGAWSGVGGGGVACQGGVDELLEANDLPAADHEVVGDADVERLAGGLVGGGVAGEDDDVLAVGDVGVVVCGPVVPVPCERLHHAGGDRAGGAVGGGEGKSGHLGPFDVGCQPGAQCSPGTGGGSRV